MWEKMKLMMSRIKEFLRASAPVVEAAALAAVRITIAKYAGSVASNSVKHDDAYDLVLDELKKQGLQMTKDFSEKMIDTAIAAAVEQLK